MAARDRLRKNREEKVLRPGQPERRLLRGRVYCGYCGTRMTGGNTGHAKLGEERTPTYMCWRHREFRHQRSETDCPGRYLSIKAAALDRAAWGQIASFLLRDDKLLEAYARSGQAAEREVKTKELRLAAIDDQIAAAEAEVRTLDLLVREDAEKRQRGEPGMNALIVQRWQADLNAAVERLAEAVGVREAALSETDHAVARAEAFGTLLEQLRAMRGSEPNPADVWTPPPGMDPEEIRRQKAVRVHNEVVAEVLLGGSDAATRNWLEKLGVRVMVRNQDDPDPASERAMLHVDLWDQDVPLAVRRAYARAAALAAAQAGAQTTSDTEGLYCVVRCDTASHQPIVVRCPTGPEAVTRAGTILQLCKWTRYDISTGCSPIAHAPWRPR
jgi:hypothetical protein